MVALKVAAIVTVAGGILTEAIGIHPGGWGFVSNAGAVVALVLWVVSSFGRRTCTEQERR